MKNRHISLESNVIILSGAVKILSPLFQTSIYISLYFDLSSENTFPLKLYGFYTTAQHQIKLSLC